MDPTPNFTNGIYLPGGNFFGHIKLDELLDVEQNPVEIGLYLRFDSWGAWIEWPVPTFITPDPPETPQWIYERPIFHESDIELGRKVHPILYGCKNRKAFYDRFNKFYKYLIRT